MCVESYENYNFYNLQLFLYNYINEFLWIFYMLQIKENKSFYYYFIRYCSMIYIFLR